MTQDDREATFLCREGRGAQTSSPQNGKLIYKLFREVSNFQVLQALGSTPRSPPWGELQQKVQALPLVFPLRGNAQLVQDAGVMAYFLEPLSIVMGTAHCD